MSEITLTDKVDLRTDSGTPIGDSYHPQDVMVFLSEIRRVVQGQYEKITKLTKVEPVTRFEFNPQLKEMTIWTRAKEGKG